RQDDVVNQLYGAFSRLAIPLLAVLSGRQIKMPILQQCALFLSAFNFLTLVGFNCQFSMAAYIRDVRGDGA
ncbi:MAG: hypothetical protein ABI885_24945, partial [Gammaproteobacteria bacterium]